MVITHGGMRNAECVIKSQSLLALAAAVYGSGRSCPVRQRCGGFTLVEIMVAIGIVVLVMLPMALSVAREQSLFRAYYYQAVALEIVDGEMEILAAGEWQQVPEGIQTWAVKAEAAHSLPTGRFLLTRRETNLRLEWVPDKKGRGGKVVREIKVQGTPAK